jgi:S-adenosylmethionine hydrolase
LPDVETAETNKPVAVIGAALDLGTDRYYATAARTFADARAGDIILYEDAYQNIAVAITDGNAAEVFAIRPGRRLVIDLVG